MLTSNKSERWVSVDDIAFHLGISKETVYRWIDKSKIPSHKIGKFWKFKISEVDTWIQDGHASDSKSSSVKESAHV